MHPAGITSTALYAGMQRQSLQMQSQQCGAQQPKMIKCGALKYFLASVHNIGLF